MNQIVEVELRGSGKVSLVVDANLLTMDTADRQFVFGLVDAFRDYGSDSDATSDLATSRDVPKSEAQIQQEVEPPATAPVGAPSVEPPFVVLDEADAPPPRVRLDTGEPVKTHRSAKAGAPPDKTAPTHFYTCLQCGYEASGPATLEAHGRIHVVPPPPAPRTTRAGRFESNMTPEQEANWVAAMAAGTPVTDDGPSPIEIGREPLRMPTERAPETVGPPPDPERVCEFCGRECGSEAARKTHQSFCEARPLAKPEASEHVHYWKMESPNGPVIKGRCSCGAEREDPASPTPILKSAEKPTRQATYDRSVKVPCELCGQSFGRGPGLASHMRGTHPEAVAG